jgi:hypothetical protein
MFMPITFNATQNQSFLLKNYSNGIDEINKK